MVGSILKTPDCRIYLGKKDGKTAVLKFSGDFFAESFVSQLTHVSDRILDLPHDAYVIDAQKGTHFNSPFFSLLVILLNQDKSLALLSPPQFLIDLRDILGLQDSLPVIESFEDFHAAQSAS